jgi:hypothetical protein
MSTIQKLRIARITVGRLYNLGNYEHVRYELTVEVPEGASAASAIRGVEKILAGLKPLKMQCIDTEIELTRKEREIEEMRKMPVAEWERRYGHCKGTPSEVIARYEEQFNESKQKREHALLVAQTARHLFDDLGGAEQWKDATLDWQDEE